MVCCLLMSVPILYCHGLLFAHVGTNFVLFIILIPFLPLRNVQPTTQVVDGLTKCAVNTLMQIGPDVVKFTGEDLKCLGRKPSPTVSCNVQHPGEVITVPPPLDSNGMPATVTVRHMSMKVRFSEKGVRPTFTTHSTCSC